MTDSDPDEVPYKPAAIDTVSLDMHNTRPRKIKFERRKSARPAAGGFSDLMSTPGKPKNTAQYRTTAASSLKSWTSQSDAGDTLEAKTVNTRFRAATLNLRSAKLANDKVITKVGKSLKSASLKRARGSTISNVQNWHKTDAESLTEGLISKKSRRQGLFGAGVRPSTTFAMAVANNSIEKRESFPMEAEGGNIGPAAAHSLDRMQSDRSCRNESRHKRSAQAPKYDTPATITLRKASRIYRCDGALLNQPSNASQDVTRLRSTLVAVSTDTTTVTLGSCDKYLEVSAVGLDQATHNETDENGIQLVARRASTNLLCDMQPEGMLDCGPTAAEPALTFAEVHTTPKVFGVNDGSRRHSVLAIETMRRASTVQIRSGGSIHEIIWDKEDSPSTRTTTSSGSALPAPGPESSPDGDSSFPSLPIACSSYEQSDGLHASVSSGNNLQSSVHNQPSENLSAWSWKTEMVGAAPDGLDVVAERKRSSIFEVVGQSKSKGGRWSKLWERPAVTKTQEIVSFPPLLDRQSTYEWRKVPFVDLNDPAWGQAVDSQKVASNASVPLSKTEVVDYEQKQVSGGSQIAGIPEDQQAVTMGTGIGVSEYHKRPSATSSQQRPHKLSNDLTKSVSR